MNKRKSITIVVMLLLFSLAGILFAKSSKEQVSDDNCQIVDSSVGMKEIPQDALVDGSFSSHLPLVVLDLEGQEIPVAYKYDMSKEILVPIEGIDPYVCGNIYLYAGNDTNSLNDTPQVSSEMHVKYRGNSSLFYDKKQYKIELLDENGAKKDENLLGMGDDSDWILNISMADKSLLRNYLAYTVAGEIDPFTPDAEYCEVLVKKGDKYEYEGLYLLCESIKVSKDRVDISKYNKDGLSSFLVKRDRYDEEAVILDTWATEQGLSYGYLSLLYPRSENLAANSIDKIQSTINQAEKVIYSDDKKVLETYPDYIDESSFVDYFLINEFFGNYDAGNNSTYMYAELDGKIHIGPVWDFDGAMDNYPDELASIDRIAFQSRSWFDRLTESDRFVMALSKRYTRLQKSYLNEKHIDKLIDDAVAYMGNARLRDYSRWHTSYDEYKLVNSEDEFGVYVERNGYTYDEEVQKLRDYISEHSEAVKEELENLSNRNVYVSSLGKYGNFACLFIVIFLCSVIIVRRKT